MNIKYVENGVYEIKDLLTLYKNAGWIAYTKEPEKLAKAYRNSLFNIGAFHEETLIGLIRVIGDDASIIYVQDILVNDDYQGLGIGSHLLKSVLKRYSHIRQIVLVTDDTVKTKSFYEKNGMLSVDKFDGVAFAKYNFDA